MAMLFKDGKVNIQVSGESSIYRQAERAIVFISVASEGSDQDTVSKEVTGMSAKLRTSLIELAEKTKSGEPTPTAPITHWTMTTLSTGSYRPSPATDTAPAPTQVPTPLEHASSSAEAPQFNSLSRRYTASTRFEAKFRSFPHLSAFVTSLSTTPYVSIAKIEWCLTAKTEASLGTQSRQDALRDAVQKATDFADALGRAVIRVVDVNGGYTNSTVAHHAAYGSGGGGLMGMKMMHGEEGHGSGGEEELSFEPQSVTLSSNVNVTFVAE